MWKEYGKPNKKFHSGKEEQWAAIQAKMESYTPNGIIKPQPEVKNDIKKEITESTTTPAAATTAATSAAPTTTTTSSTASS